MIQTEHHPNTGGLKMIENRFSRILTVLCFSLIGWAAAQGFRVFLPNSLTLMYDKDNASLITVRQPISEFVMNETTKQCLTDAFETPGQAWRVNVSAGGVTLFAAKQTTITPRDRGIDLGLGSIRAPTRDVNVLVIDKFGPTKFQLKENESGPLLELNLKHGNLVSAHLSEVIKAANKPNTRIKISTVDIDRILPGPRETQVTTLQLVSFLQQEMKNLEIDEGRPLIINMSIAILPCALQQRYIELRDEASKMKPPMRLPFKLFLDEVVKLNKHETDAEKYIKSIIAPTSLRDPLQKWLEEEQSTWNKNLMPFVVVASSGNYGLKFQTLPAAWPAVLGVAASTVKLAVTKTEWSDAGDVVEVGEWYTLGGANSIASFRNILTAISVQDPGPSLVYPVDPRSFAYRGTSFSAPTVTAALAFALGNPNSKCFGITIRKSNFQPFSNKNINIDPPLTSFASIFQQCQKR